MFICIDFDGTIVDHAYPEVGQAVPGAIQWMRSFNDAGAKLMLWTMRSNREERNYLGEAVSYLMMNKIELHGVNHNPDQDSWTDSPKCYGNIYIDDAAFGCPLIKPPGFQRMCVNWDIVGPIVYKMITDQ